MQEKDITAKRRAFHPDHSLSVQIIEMDRRRKREMGEHKGFKTNSEEAFQWMFVFVLMFNSNAQMYRNTVKYVSECLLHTALFPI